MLQYVINTSIIWLASLLLYEWLLRRERFHQYNRIYLLASLTAGLLLPAASLNSLLPPGNDVLPRPTERIYEIRKQVDELKQPAAIKEATTSTAPAHTDTATAIWALYLAGVLAAVVLLVREIFQLFHLYTRGSKRREHGCTIVETGKGHCPFSFFNIVFISSRRDYSADQWVMLIAHEKEHSRQLHSLDNMLLIVLRSVFWFHPLPHIYYRRLRMVHEFQADQAAASSTADYGIFLLEQNLLQGAPVLTHSFNYSPIKNRIAMLTGTRSTRARLLKYLAVAPLSLMFCLFCTQTSFSGETGGKSSKAYFKGNEVAFGGLKVIPFEYVQTIEQQIKMFRYAVLPDSVLIKDWRTGRLNMVAVHSDMMPVALNGKPVFGNERQYMLTDDGAKYTAPVLSQEETNLYKYLFTEAKGSLDKLEDGIYAFHINRMVIDDQGNIAYYENEGIDISMGSNERHPLIADNIRHDIYQKLAETLDGPLKFKPALIDEKPVNFRVPLGGYEILVKDHKAKLVERGGC